MKILSIETSCDETAAAVISKGPKENFVKILSNVVASSLLYHSKTGGIVPEVAAREQLKFIIPVIEKTIKDSKLSIKDIDAMAITVGPGLIGSLLVGVETAKTLAYLWNKPIIPVNHLIGHFYANWIDNNSTDDKLKWSEPQFPLLGLLVSGGHSDLVLFKDHMDYECLGGTRDDASGECFDKCARVLGFAYPGGPKISALAQKGQPTFKLPIPMLDSHDLDFSFSGLKTAFVNVVSRNFKLEPGKYDDQTKSWVQKPLEDQLSENKLKEIYNLCASLENSIVESLVRKTIAASKLTKVKQIIIAGGVAVNGKLREVLATSCQKLEVKFFVPQKSLCTDNAAMIGAYAAFSYKPIPWKNIAANPQLHF